MLCTIGILFIYLVPHTLFAQSTELVTLKLDNASLQTVFSAIESQTAYHFIFTGEEAEGSKTRQPVCQQSQSAGRLRNYAFRTSRFFIP